MNRAGECPLLMCCDRPFVLNYSFCSPFHSQLRIASQRFQVHLHSAVDDPCVDCHFGHLDTEETATRHLIPLVDSVSRSSTPNGTTRDRHGGSIRSKEQKWQDFKSDMKSLRSAMLSGDAQSGAQSTAEVPSLRAGQPESAVPQRAYIDRAKMRRQAHGSPLPQRPSTNQSHRRISPVPEARSAAPTYGIGQALLNKMTKPVPSNHDNATSKTATRLGTVVEVRTSGVTGAGIGSGRLIQSVEEIALRNAQPGSQLQDKRQQRWTAALARGDG